MPKYHENLLRDSALSLFSMVKSFSSVETKMILKMPNKTFLRIAQCQGASSCYIVCVRACLCPCAFARKDQYHSTFTNKAGYTAESVACNSAGAVMQKLPRKRRKSKYVTNRPTNRPTDRRANIVTYRVACTRLNNKKKEESIFAFAPLRALLHVKECNCACVFTP